MNFTTQVEVEKVEENKKIDYNSKIISLGSCFADNMAEKLSLYGFDIHSNIFGVIFNIVSIENLVEKACNDVNFQEKDLFLYNELWNCFQVHSKCSGGDKKVVLQELNHRLKYLREEIQKATHVIITLGTSWVYRDNDSQTIVANCYKVPQEKFTKQLLSIEQTKHSLEQIHRLVTNINENCKFILTISPVRHLKDGFVENNRSKSIIVEAIHSFLKARNDCHYFPSYEIVMDELRDYRFYNQDMVHPSQVAIEYIFEKFKDSWIAEEEMRIMKEVESIKKGLNHKPFNKDTNQYKMFTEGLKKRILEVKKYNNKINI